MSSGFLPSPGDILETPILQSHGLSKDHELLHHALVADLEMRKLETRRDLAAKCERSTAPFCAVDHELVSASGNEPMSENILCSSVLREFSCNADRREAIVEVCHPTLPKVQKIRPARPIGWPRTSLGLREIFTTIRTPR